MEIHNHFKKFSFGAQDLSLTDNGKNIQIYSK